MDGLSLGLCSSHVVPLLKQALRYVLTQIQQKEIQDHEEDHYFHRSRYIVFSRSESNYRRRGWLRTRAVLRWVCLSTQLTVTRVWPVSEAGHSRSRVSLPTGSQLVYSDLSL